MNGTNENTQQPLALVVDDELNIREMLCDALETYGFLVLTASDGMEAWELYQKNEPHIVISDIYMPKMNGIMLLKQIKERDPRRPVILITGYHHYKQLVDTAEYPPDGFLSKPFRLNDLFTAISQILGNVASPGG